MRLHGKSGLAIELAKKIDGEIISADSMQIYKDMNIGTAKVLEDEMQGIKHYMLDIISPEERYSVSDFKKQAEECIEQILQKGKMPIICGGTGLYINSLIYGIEFANETAKKLLQFSEELERDNYIEAIADKYGMGFENLRKLVYHFGTQGLTGSEPRQKKSREKPQKEDGMKQSQRLLLTWLIEDTRLFELIEEYLESQEGVRV